MCIQVAVKCLSKERMQNNTLEFMKEYEIMQSIDHNHIVRLYGVILDAAQIMLITELFRKSGSLTHPIEERPGMLTDSITEFIVLGTDLEDLVRHVERGEQKNLLSGAPRLGSVGQVVDLLVHVIGDRLNTLRIGIRAKADLLAHHRNLVLLHVLFSSP